MKFYAPTDIGLVLLYLTFAVLGCLYIRSKLDDSDPVSRYFMPAVLAKMGGAMGFVLIYTFYYAGGDTTTYHESASSIIGLASNDLFEFFEVWFGENTPTRLTYFDMEVGKPKFWGAPHAFNVGRLAVPFQLLSFGSYPVTSLLIALFSFTGSWRLFKMFSKMYPALTKHFAVACLFVPSVLFWGSGLSKDTFTYMALCWCCVSFYHLVLDRRKMVFYSITMILAIMIMVSIKPYIFVAVLPALTYWGIASALATIKSVAVRIVVMPLVLVIGLGLGALVWSGVQQSLGEYGDIDAMMQKAQISQIDLKRAAYGGNSFDIGDYDANLSSILGKFPEATVAGLYRPTLRDANNIVMYFSAFENTIMVLLTIAMIVALVMVRFKTLGRDAVVVFCLLFVVTFAFSIGISTSNFGALVRFKIPLIPFFYVGCFICFYRVGWITAKKQVQKQIYNNQGFVNK